VGDVTDGNRVTFSTRIPHDTPRLPSLIDVYAGANWHEREAHEMFGIDFLGHPDLSHLYLPEGFLGNPLRKTFPLLSREVKPWPGKVDVEAMPGAEEEEGDEGAEEESEDEV
jgi:NADH-quinone oxidoreductase subunit C